MCGLRYGLYDSTCAYPLMPASVTMRTTGLSPMTAHFRSVIIICPPDGILVWDVGGSELPVGAPCGWLTLSANPTGRRAGRSGDALGNLDLATRSRALFGRQQHLDNVPTPGG